MNDIDDDAADDLTLRYRRASAGDPSRPSVLTRAAIIAQARTAMTYRTSRAADEASVAQMEAAPAANDSQWNVRAVAGLAVVGLVGMLAMLTLRNSPGPDAPRTTVTAQSIPAPLPLESVRSADTERDSPARNDTAPATIPGATAQSAHRSVGIVAGRPNAFPGNGIATAAPPLRPTSPVPALAPPASEVRLIESTQALRGPAAADTAESAAARSRVAAAASHNAADDLVLPPPQIPAQQQKYYDAAWAEVQSLYPQVLADASGRYSVVSVLLTAEGKVRASRLRTFDSQQSAAGERPDFSLFEDIGVRADDLDLNRTFGSATTPSKTIDIASKAAASSPVWIHGFVLKSDIGGAHSSSKVNTAVRAHFSGGLPISRPQVNVALFTVFMTENGQIARSKLEYVVGQGLSALSATAATTERFVALGIPRDQIGQMGTTLISDEPGVDEEPTPSSEDDARQIQELEERRRQLLLRFTPLHPEVAALDASLKQLQAKQVNEGGVCCRLVMVAYAWPRTASDPATLPVQSAMGAPASIDSATINAIAVRYFPVGSSSQEPGATQAWVLLDNQGKVLRTGSHGFDRSDQIAEYLRSKYPGVKVANTLMTNAQTQEGNGKSLPIAFLWLTQDSALPQ